MTNVVRLWSRFSALALAAAAIVVTPFFAVETSSATDLETSVIIQVPDGSTSDLLSTLASLSVTPEATYTTTIDGAAAVLTPGEISTIVHRIPAARVSPDLKLHVADTQAAPTWGLDSIDQASSTPDNSYTFPESAGEGVDVFVIDSGLRATTYALGGELYGRVPETHNLVNDRSDAYDARECLVGRSENSGKGGHGTHVAGIIASTTYGVAKKANIIPLRVFPCANSPTSGDASTSDVISAIQLAVQIHQRRNLPGIINLSLAGACDFTDCANDALTAAVNGATQPSQVSGTVFTGLTVTVAAGNGDSNNVGVDACNTSPAAATSAITVGATDQARVITSFSNWGHCVSLFAPGFQIRSLNAWYQVPDADPTNPFISMNGTSMASPFAAGAAALYLSKNPDATPAQVKNALTSNAIQGAVTGLVGNKAASPNRFLNVSFLNKTLTAPSSATASAPSVWSVRLDWNPSTTSDGSPITDYSVQYRAAGASAWRIFAHAPLGSSTGITVSRLSPGTSIDFRIAGVSGTVMGPFGAPTTATTLTGKPSAVTELVAVARTTTSLSLDWGLPTTLNGGTINDYYLSYRRAGTTTWTRFSDGVSSRSRAIVSQLRARTTYNVVVFPKTSQGYGPGAYLTARTR